MSHAYSVYSAFAPNAPSEAAFGPSRSHVATFLVRALADVLQQRGIAPELLLGPRIDILHAELERSVPRAWFQALFARAVQLTNDPALGIHCGLYASNASFGLMAPLIGHADSLRRGLELVRQFHPLLVDGFRMQLTEQLGVAELRCEVEPLGPGDRSFAELVVAGLTRTLQAFGCTKAEIRAVRFEHARPAYFHAYTSAFEGKERFSQPGTSIEFAASALDRPHLHRLAELHEVVLAQAEHSLMRCSRPLTVTERASALIHSRPASQLPDMVLAARELGFSVRSLRRHLEQEGTTYRELTQARLHACACTLLRNPNVPLQSVAFELGFSDATAFHRAFRRWAKTTPAEYRSSFMSGEQALSEAGRAQD